MAEARLDRLCDLQCQANQCVYRVPIFSHLAKEELMEVGKLVRRKNFPSKARVFSMGESIKGLYILRYGSIKLVRYSPDGNEVIVEVLRSGDFYGGDQMFHQAFTHEDAITLEETGVCFIKNQDLLEMISKNPDIAIKIIQVLSAMHNEDRTLLSILGEKNALHRLALFLLWESNKHPFEPLSLTREDIARRISLTQETVSRKLSQLRREGFVETPGYGKILMKDPDKLQARLNLDLNQRI